MANGAIVEAASDVVLGRWIMSTNLVEQGIAAFQAKNMAQAQQLLSQAVQQYPNDERAWYYLAAAVEDPAQRKQYLERVLQINPNNDRARQVLDKVNAQLAKVTAPTGSRGTPAVTPQPRPPTQAAPVPSSDLPPPPSSGFKIPVSIPDAPETVDPPYLIAAAKTVVMASINVLRRVPGVYTSEMMKATWWRFWLLVGAGAVVAVVAGFIGSIFLEIQLSSINIFGVTHTFNIMSPIIALIFSGPISLITLFAACYGSHWYATSQGGQVSLVQHSYTAVLPLVGARIVGNIIVAITSFSVFLSGLGGLISFIISIYALVYMVDGFQSLYHYNERNKAWILAGAMLVSAFVVSIALGAIIGIFGANLVRVF